MAVMKELWDECVYMEPTISSQNLRDQAAKLEKVMGDIQGTIIRNAGNGRKDSRVTITLKKETTVFNLQNMF